MKKCPFVRNEAECTNQCVVCPLYQRCKCGLTRGNHSGAKWKGKANKGKIKCNGFLPETQEVYR